MNKKDTILTRLAQQIIETSPNQRAPLFLEKEIPMQSAIFEILSPHQQQKLLSELNDKAAVDLLDALDLRTAHIVVAQMKNKVRRELLIARLKNELRVKAEQFLQFHDSATLSLINFNYLLLSSETTIEEAAHAIEQHYQETKRFPEILVHQEGHYVGEVPYIELVRTTNRTKLKKIVTSTETVYFNADESDILELIHTAESNKLIIKDTDESVIGLIYTDDLRGLLNNQPAKSLYEFAGVAESERPFDDVKTKVQNRYKWLILNLGTAFLAAGVVSLFEETISMYVVLAIYLPIIAGMGGNAANQTLAIMVRGITTGEIHFKNFRPALIREVTAGAIHGAIIGVLVALIAVFWNQDPLLGLVLALAMIFNMIISGFFGTIIPLLMKKLGKDPATSATIFITTATDVFGFLSFLLLATLILL